MVELKWNLQFHFAIPIPIPWLAIPIPELELKSIPIPELTPALLQCTKISLSDLNTALCHDLHCALPALALELLYISSATDLGPINHFWFLVPLCH